MKTKQHEEKVYKACIIILCNIEIWSILQFHSTAPSYFFTPFRFSQISPVSNFRACFFNPKKKKKGWGKLFFLAPFVLTIPHHGINHSQSTIQAPSTHCDAWVVFDNQLGNYHCAYKSSRNSGCIIEKGIKFTQLDLK